MARHWRSYELTLKVTLLGFYSEFSIGSGQWIRPFLAVDTQMHNTWHLYAGPLHFWGYRKHNAMIEDLIGLGFGISRNYFWKDSISLPSYYKMIFGKANRYGK